MQIMLGDDFKDFIELLNKHQVNYMLVGGFALAAHGHPRYTKDIDIFISTSDDNAAKMVKVMNDFGVASFGLKTTDFKDNDVIQIGHAPNRIDVLKQIDGITFDEAFQNCVNVDLSGSTIRLISKPDLIKNKLASGRTQDLADVEVLNEN